MSVISLADIIRVLRQYHARYRWLDVFSHQIRELHEPTHLQFFPTGENQYRVQVGSEQLDLQMYRRKGVVRCSLGSGQIPSSAAIAGAAVGAIVGAGIQPKGPEGLVLGLLLGGLMGAALGSQAGDTQGADENRVMTLRYEPATQAWRVYHGPYIGWAKEALRPG
jgi:hypothetical protein